MGVSRESLGGQKASLAVPAESPQLNRFVSGPGNDPRIAESANSPYLEMTRPCVSHQLQKSLGLKSALTGFAIIDDVYR